MAKSTSVSLAQIQIDPQQLADVRGMLQYVKLGAERAIMRSLNKTIRGVETDTAKVIYADLNLTQKRIKKDIGYTKANLASLTASVYSRGKHIPLIEYGAKQTATGVTIKVHRGKPTALIPGTFIGKAQGELQVMSRPKAKVGTGKPIGVPKSGYLYTFPARWNDVYREGTRVLYGSSIPEIWSNAPIMADILAKAQDRLHKNLDHEAEYLVMQQLEAGDGSDG